MLQVHTDTLETNQAPIRQQDATINSLIKSNTKPTRRGLEEHELSPPTVIIEDTRTRINDDQTHQWIWARGTMQQHCPPPPSQATLLQSKDLETKRIYHSLEIAPQYLQAIGIEHIPQVASICCHVVSLFYRPALKGEGMEYLYKRKQKRVRHIYSFQLTELSILENIYWSTKLCKQQVTNDTLSKLQNIIQNYNMHNPLASSEKAE
ncbi:hypothetical protein M758_UG019800 [Ceratodon purpureus]|nr:hypothetical protein M758_UG019800 [Ceratodon purpureus]